MSILQKNIKCSKTLWIENINFSSIYGWETKRMGKKEYPNWGGRKEWFVLAKLLGNLDALPGVRLSFFKILQNYSFFINVF